MKDTFLEDLFWTSYRYCIGRHSYVTTFASDMAEYFYDKIDDDRKPYIAQDIRRSIADCLQFKPFNVNFDYTIRVEDRKPMEYLLDFINSISSEYENDEKREKKIQEFLAHIDNISFFKERDYDKILTEISRTNKPRFEHTIYEHELLDLLPWMDLASLFDISKHKIAVCIDKDGNEKEYEVYESYINDSIIVEQNEKYAILTSIPWKYKKIYRIVEDGISNKYLDETNIKEIKDCDRNGKV